MGLGNLSDDELVAKLRAPADGTRDALVNELFSRHYERVARWCLRFTGNRETAADLAQDVFLKAHRHLDSFRGTARFGTWLYTIVRNESLNRLQRSAAPLQDDGILDALPALGPGPDAVAERADRSKRLAGFLAATLDETEQAVFTLHYGDEMPLEAVTRLLRLSNPSGAKAYIVSAKRKLARATTRLRARGEQL
jgi:RNA polymerase sigma-70 factor (ECF subfamily)